MARSRSLTARALELLQGGMSGGRDTMEEVVSRGQRAMEDGQRAMRDWMPRRQRRPTGPWLWFAGGAAAGALALLVGRKAGPVLPWGNRCVGDLMVRDVQTIDSSASLTQAAQRMRDTNVGMLPVVEGGRLRGIVTDRDLVVRGLARGGDPSALRVGECATHDLIAARPDWTVDQAMRTMAEHQVGRLPVIDDMDRVVGIVTLSSLALRSSQQDDALDTAKEVSRRSARAV
jgi:CBS domain-containing protein